MYNYIKIQYELYQKGQSTIEIKKIQTLAQKYLSSEQKENIFSL